MVHVGVIGNHTPPAPNPDASTYPRNDGSPGTSSSTDVGLEDILDKSMFQSSNACLSGGVIWIVCWFGCVERAL